MAAIPPPRITLLTAESQPVIVAVCRVRTKLWRIVSIDSATGAIELGRWWRGHAYPHNASLSPSGMRLSFACTRGYMLGSPPHMNPCYLFDGSSSYGPTTFLTEESINVGHGGFTKSSDGSKSPFVVNWVPSPLSAIAIFFRRLLQKRKIPAFHLRQARNFWTEPDLGVIDDKVFSGVILVTGELVSARLGIVTCYEVSHDIATERWRVDLTRLYDDFDPTQVQD